MLFIFDRNEEHNYPWSKQKKPSENYENSHLSQNGDLSMNANEQQSGERNQETFDKVLEKMLQTDNKQYDIPEKLTVSHQDYDQFARKSRLPMSTGKKQSPSMGVRSKQTVSERLKAENQVRQIELVNVDNCSRFKPLATLFCVNCIQKINASTYVTMQETVIYGLQYTHPLSN